MDKEIMSNLQKQFNKVNRKVQILNNEVDTLKKNKNITGLWRLVPFCLLMRIMVRMRVSVI